ncbi:head-tail connector protein [Sphingomonas sp. PR090111-T3T-6A]|uniref:head-tail connector protein n=1 Tax=Sphingomonas sp. PR090111-T3T-6A TaxID=685778 RepID=UPI000365EFE0|nr:head-tail connector protein [Sphingomonas sp. PR090111-T3T-6A]
MSAPDGALADAKALLRVDAADEDALIETLIGAAMGVCERFTGLVLLAADRSDAVPVARGWQRLPATPVAAITSVAALGVGAVATPLAVDAYAIDIDAAGDGWVRLSAPVATSRLLVGYRAGLAADWPSLPEALRQGVLRLVAHLHAHRDVMADAGPPAVVAALWRPWRRMRLA